ncbi:3-oxoacyl-ACP reductase family protein [Caulobacter endophyticus]|uniref:3-oxoacyl-ACP reductase family protein n=1 Tax=Caulobacter endophyticus TaxID=2172652 RepID=UPI0024103C30|nr:3-oxoacyl-ACP reductase family protein [Caulobacter endophyticus]MDG2528990.1 3-oxoacyl-ACP reductase FabG [Caulobacter endophyticus]
MDFEGEHQGKVALVLGGSRGIGAAIVERLAMDGAKVAFTYFASPDQAQALAARLSGQSCEVVAIQADSGDAAQVEAAIDETLARYGRLDILVASTGVLHRGAIEQISLEEFDRVMAVNVRGAFAAVRHAAPRMSDGGRIVTIGSNIVARVGFTGATLYTMAKAAIAALVKGAALDLAARGITVNNIQPGPTTTDMTSAHVEMILPLIPLGRMGRPAEVAGLVSYLARDEAGFITGASLTIDGGVSV